MSATVWSPPTVPSKREEALLYRMIRRKKLFEFLPPYHRKIFDGAFQAERRGRDRASEVGKCPVPPALLAMATVLQAYFRTSDAEAVELSLVDAR
jgi:hypothetical protein